MIATCFKTGSDGQLRNPRLDRERQEAEAVSAANSINGTKGGKPKHKQPSERLANAKPNLNLSESESERTSTLAPSARVSFDFEALYQTYPRKKGKTRGVERLKALVKNEAEFQSVKRGLECFIADERRNGTKPNFFPYFSTWVNEKRWLDYTEKQPANGTLSGESKRLTLEERIRAREEAENAAALPNARQQQPGLFPDSAERNGRAVEQNGTRNLSNGEPISGGHPANKPSRANPGVGG